MLDPKKLFLENVIMSAAAGLCIQTTEPVLIKFAPNMFFYPTKLITLLSKLGLGIHLQLKNNTILKKENIFNLWRFLV